MRKFNNIQIGLKLFFAAVMLSMVSCSDFLDQENESFVDKETTFRSYNHTSAYLVTIYSFLPNGYTDLDNNILYDAATDDADCVLANASVKKFNFGIWDALSNPDDVWNKYYTAIRKCCELIDNVDKVDLEQYRLDPAKQTEYVTRMKDLEMWKAEAHFLRAFFNFELLKRYGPVPMIEHSMSLDEDYTTMQRPTMQECIDFICKDCDEAASVLDITPWPTKDSYGRATKVSALALKSRMLLYAASPLYMDWENTDEASMPSDPAKWEAAANAAKEVIDLLETKPGKGLQTLYATIFANSDDAIKSKEHLFMRRSSASSNFEVSNFPVSYGGKGGTAPSQNLVDEYEMQDGYTVDPANPYLNRDRRLAATVVVNGDTWLFGAQNTVETWNGGKDSRDKVNGSRTGYYLRKLVNTSVNIQTGGTALGHLWPLIRMSEIYLNYVEALNEYAPGSKDIITYINLLRKRGKVTQYKTVMEQDEMRKAIRHERRVELALEGHRAWDVRRWKIASSTLGATVKGINITRMVTETPDVYDYKYEVCDVEKRTFMPKMYWYPIPQNEILHMKNWKQNPGW